MMNKIKMSGSILAVLGLIVSYQNCSKKFSKGASGTEDLSSITVESVFGEFCSAWMDRNNIGIDTLQAESADLILLGSCVYLTSGGACNVLDKGPLLGSPGNGFKPVLECEGIETRYGNNSYDVDFETRDGAGNIKNNFSRTEIIKRIWRGLPQDTLICQENLSVVGRCNDKANYTSMATMADWGFSASNGDTFWEKTTDISLTPNLNVGGYFYSYVYSPTFVNGKIIKAEPFVIE